MERFALLLDRLYYTHSNLAKAALLKEYFADTDDPDRGYTVAALAGELSFDLFKRHTIRDLIKERVDETLYDMSRDYVGETSETVAHLWPVSDDAVRLNRLPLLHEVIERFSTSDKQGVRDYLTLLLDNMSSEQRWALLKLGTRGLRVGVSARFVKKVLAEYGDVHVNDIETLWHGLKPPYADLFAWLEGKGEKPDVSDSITFHPVMLSHPIDADKELTTITPGAFSAEWKYDGIRVQLVSSPKGKALFSRTGDDISHSFPDLLNAIEFHGILDAELLVKRDGAIASFNDLQQRLGKKAPTKKLMEANPAHLVVYDLLELDGEDLRELSLVERQARLGKWIDHHKPERIEQSLPLDFTDAASLMALRDEAASQQGGLIEGLMLKRRDSAYIPGRPKGYWYKWKRDPMLLDAVLMYAQRGSGKRSSFYSDYTFGLWKENDLLPIGKAYSGFTDEELKKLDKWVRDNTLNRFGPVREVKKEMVFEVAFDSAHTSARHKSGYALRFPRIHRIRWDKPAHEADQMAALAALIPNAED